MRNGHVFKAAERSYVRAAGQPEVVELNDNGRRKVMLRFDLGGVEFELELADPAKLERGIQDARVWVDEG